MLVRHIPTHFCLPSLEACACQYIQSGKLRHIPTHFCLPRYLLCSRSGTHTYTAFWRHVLVRYSQASSGKLRHIPTHFCLPRYLLCSKSGTHTYTAFWRHVLVRYSQASSGISPPTFVYLDTCCVPGQVHTGNLHS